MNKLDKIKEALAFTEEVKAYINGCPICFVGPKSVRWLIKQLEKAWEENAQLKEEQSPHWRRFQRHRRTGGK